MTDSETCEIEAIEAKRREIEADTRAIEALLERKRIIDASSKDKFVETQRWLIDVVMHLLKVKSKP